MVKLFITYFKAKSEERQKEIDFCLQENSKNKTIDKIYVLCENQKSYIKNDKIILQNTFCYPTIGSIINYINRIDNSDINILANCDIITDETLSLVISIKNKECYALSRYEEYKNANSLNINGDSQDMWIFKGKILLKNKIDFKMGIPGCDNRFNYEIKNSGYTISNPSKDIKTWHIHNSKLRTLTNDNHDEKKPVEKPYLILKPDFLNKI